MRNFLLFGLGMLMAITVLACLFPKVFLIVFGALSAVSFPLLCIMLKKAPMVDEEEMLSSAA